LYKIYQWLILVDILTVCFYDASEFVKEARVVMKNPGSLETVPASSSPYGIYLPAETFLLVYWPQE